MEALRAFRRCLHQILCDERVVDIVGFPEWALGFGLGVSGLSLTGFRTGGCVCWLNLGLGLGFRFEALPSLALRGLIRVLCLGFRGKGLGGGVLGLGWELWAFVGT